MKKLTNALFILLAATALLTVSGQAQAQPNCLSGDVVDADGNPVPPSRMNNLGYRAGAAGGRSLVLQVKAGAGEIDPTEVEAFADSVIERIRTVADVFVAGGLSDYNSCRIRGFLQGAANELQDCVEEVGALCAEEGRIWANLSATLYCDLSAAFGLVPIGLLPKKTDLGICGSSFETACTDDFFALVAGVEDVDTGELVGGLCPEFSVDPHTEVFEETQYNQCIFEIDEEP